MSTYYNDEIEELKNNILKTGIHVHEMLHTAINNTVVHDVNHIHSLNSQYNKIVNSQTEIENKVMHLIPALYQNEKALKDIVGIIKISVHLERIAARCRYIGAMEIPPIPFRRIKFDFLRIREMIEKSIDLFLEILRVYRNEDSDKAKKIALKDYSVQRFHYSFFIQIISEIKRDPEDVEQYLKFIYLNRDIEGLSDHIRMICEWIYFDVTGQYVVFRNDVIGVE